MNSVGLSVSEVSRLCFLTIEEFADRCRTNLQTPASYGLRLQDAQRISYLNTSGSVADTNAVCGHLLLVAGADVPAALVHLGSTWAECVEDDLRRDLLLGFHRRVGIVSLPIF